MNKITVAVVAVMAAAASSRAGVTTLNTFHGEWNENFVSSRTGFLTNGQTAMAGAATLNSSLTSGLLVTSSWGFTGTIRPQSDTLFLGNYAASTDWVFNTEIHRFGGYFGTNANFNGGGTATFYDAQNAVIGTMPIDAPRLTWAWNGWESTAAIARVRLSLGAMGGAFLMQDTMTASSLPAPGAFALAACGGLALLRRRRASVV